MSFRNIYMRNWHGRLRCTNELEHTTQISRFKPRLIMPLYFTIIKSKVACQGSSANSHTEGYRFVHWPSLSRSLFEPSTLI
jgi:hypothetical protein